MLSRPAAARWSRGRYVSCLILFCVPYVSCQFSVYSSQFEHGTTSGHSSLVLASARKSYFPRFPGFFLLPVAFLADFVPLLPADFLPVARLPPLPLAACMVTSVSPEGAGVALGRAGFGALAGS